MRVLMTAQPGSGHWRPLAPLAGALVGAGHEVAFATTPAFCAVIDRHGFRCFPAGSDEPTAESGPGAAAPRQAATVWAETFAGTRAAGRLPDLLAIGREWRPDLVVRELTEFAGCVAAERLGIPHAAVQITAWRPHLHAVVAAPLDRLRRGIGLPPDPALAMLYRHLLLTPVPPRFQPVGAPLPATARGMRHVPFDREGEAAAPAWIAGLPARPTVYATLGTAYNRTPGVLAAILDGLAGEPITLIVTTGGGQDPADFGARPANVRVERYVPQSLLFPRCDLVVCHGGFGTVMTALGHGLPLVVIPIAADQPDNARRCAELEVGRVVPPERRPAAAIREAVRAVMGDGRYRRNAERVREEMAGLPDLGQAVGLLEGLAATRRAPVGTPAG